MKRWMKWLVSPAVLGTIGLIVLSALVWWVGPLLAIGSWRPLDAILWRALLVGLIWLAWISSYVWRAWRQRRSNSALLQGISSATSAIDKESEVLEPTISEAIEKLKGAGKRGLFSAGASTLYQLPWYVFIGAPGSGKRQR